MNDADIITGWLIVLVVTIGIFLAIIRFLNWYRHPRKPDILKPEEYVQERFSLPRDR